MRKINSVPLLVLFVVFLFGCQKQSPQTIAATPTPTPELKPIAVPPPPEIGKPYPGTGIVKLINKPEGWIEINHEEIPGLMPAMEMEWSVQKRSMLDKVKVGDKVNFVVVETGKGEILTELKKAQ